MRWQLDQDLIVVVHDQSADLGFGRVGFGCHRVGRFGGLRRRPHQVHPVSGKSWSAGKRGLIRVWVRRRPAGISRRVGRNRFDRFRSSGSTGSGSSGSTGSAAGGSTTRPTIASQYQAAFTACRSDLPTGGFGGGGGFNSATTAAYRNCLTLHGVTIPTTPPSTTAGSSGQRGGLGALRNNPKFQAAEKACASLLPARTGAGTSTTVPAAS